MNSPPWWPHARASNDASDLRELIGRQLGVEQHEGKTAHDNTAEKGVPSQATTSRSVTPTCP